MGLVSDSHDAICWNKDRIAVIENRLDYKHERINELEDNIHTVDSRVGRLENSLNDLHVELVALNTSLNTTTKIITVIGVLITILLALPEVLIMAFG